MTTGVLLMYYGTPSGPDDIERYYTDIRGGRTPSREHLEELAQRYASIGNHFPLARITRQQAEGLQAELDRRDPGAWRVFLGAKHAPPFLGDAVRRMEVEGISRGVGLVLAPHYSRMSIGGYIERAKAALPDDGSLELSFVESWHLHPGYLSLLSERVAEARRRLTEDQRQNDLAIFTAHSLPERIAEEGDPYPRQLEETAEAVAGRLGLERVTTGWQSAGRTPEPWLGPPLTDLIARASAEGRTAAVVCPCGFVADHLEVLYDVDIEAAEAAERAGIPLVRTASMNADPAFLRALAAVVREHVGERR